MNRIDKRFSDLNGKKALIGFITAGDPDLETTGAAMLTMQDEGVDIIELGIPFSDPAADGPVIQEADLRALASGTDIFKVFDFLKEARNKVTVPVVFLLYYNVIVQYGADAFFKKCAECGADGVIIPDLPYEECAEIKEYTDKYNVYQILMVSPTSRERIKTIAANAKGFLYCVSSLGVTGMKKSFDTDFDEFFSLIKSSTKVPACIGFGISNGEQVRKLSKYCDGVISGSAIVKAMAEGRSLEEKLENLRNILRDLKSGLQ